MVEAVAIMDHIAARHYAHPSQVRVGREEITVGRHPVVGRGEIDQGWIEDERFAVSDR